MRRLASAAIWTIPVLACVTIVVVSVLLVDLGVHLYRFGIYDGSRMTCSTKMTHIDDIHACQALPFP